NQPTDNLGMPAMNPVEIADRDGPAACDGGEIVGMTDNLHGGGSSWGTGIPSIESPSKMVNGHAFGPTPGSPPWWSPQPRRPSTIGPRGVPLVLGSSATQFYGPPFPGSFHASFSPDKSADCRFEPARCFV